MRAVLTNLGSTGDIWPFLALAVELRRHGHSPLLALSPNFAPLAQRFNLPFVPFGPEIDFEQLRSLAASVLLTSNSAQQTRPLLAHALQSLPQMFAELRDLCREADVVIGGTAQPATRMVHEVIGIPFISIHTVSFAIWGTQLLQKAVAPMINYYRSREGLPALHDPIVADAHSPQLALHAISKYVLHPASNWPAHYHITGYFFLDEEEWNPDPELLSYLASGSPPVVISFGSMLHDDPEELTNLVLDAIRLAGCRAILQQGWSGLGKKQLPPDVHVVGFVPHHWLFPQAGCVVHHGATGTTGATFRAGVPAVFVPHAYEHPLNAEVARELKCAGPAVPYRQLTAKRLASAITATLTTEQYHQAARLLGEKVRAEQGVSAARQLIEQMEIRRTYAGK